ncbi:MAG: hypothetical protein H8E36_03600 [Rhodospirillaceae bacterium]|nr:hypothetical protein [Rhodospirillaceae bacterium]MBL6941022.1 hypothetical protein [Rhodospirillales bacterium]
MSSATLEKIFGLIASLLVTLFVLGLAESISSGAAGFWGGLPFWVICFGILPLVFYDFWDSCLRKKPNGNGNGNGNNV